MNTSRNEQERRERIQRLLPAHLNALLRPDDKPRKRIDKRWKDRRGGMHRIDSIVPLGPVGMIVVLTAFILAIPLVVLFIYHRYRRDADDA